MSGRTTSISQTLSLIALGSLLLASPGRASASERFPRALQNAVGAPFESPCSLCHLGDYRTNDSVTTRFGRAMRARGLAAGDEDSLIHALDAMRVDDVDSDLDGVTDIEELQIGTDPNLRPDQVPEEAINYGCSVAEPGAPHTHRESASPLGTPAWILASAALLALCAVRRSP